MEQMNVKLKKWGNSYGIIMPMKFVEKENLKDGSDLIVNVRVKRPMTAGDLMELSKKLGLAEKLKNIDTAKELKRIDKELWPENE